MFVAVSILIDDGFFTAFRGFFASACLRDDRLVEKAFIIASKSFPSIKTFLIAYNNAAFKI